MRPFLLFCLFLLPLPFVTMAQQVVQSDEDLELRLELKKKYKNIAGNYSHKQFDALFMEFFQVTGPSNPDILTKEEFYGYTVRIALYSHRLGVLYKDQKEMAQKGYDDWFNRKYSDYLATKRATPQP